jgi:hypothetical protein
MCAPGLRLEARGLLILVSLSLARRVSSLGYAVSVLGPVGAPRHMFEKYLQICEHLLRSALEANFGGRGGLADRKIARSGSIRIGRTNSNLVETQSVEDHPQQPRHHDHPADRQRITNYQRENIIHGLPP